MNTFAEEKWFRTGGYGICYRAVPARGRQVGRIFLLHGFIQSSLYWEKLARLFSNAGYLCAMPDLPGFGYSTREARHVPAKDREAIVAELMEALAPGEPWVVVGHSMGGGIAVNLAAMFPEKVTSLLLYAPGSVAGGLGENSPMRYLAEPAAVFLYPLLAPLVYVNPLARLLCALSNADLRYGMGFDIRRTTDPLKLPGTVRSLAYMVQRAKTTDYGAAAALKIPILVLWAEKEYVLLPGMVSRMKAGLPQAVSQTMRGGHQFSERYAAEVFERSMAFLRGATAFPGGAAAFSRRNAQ